MKDLTVFAGALQLEGTSEGKVRLCDGVQVEADQFIRLGDDGLELNGIDERLFVSNGLDLCLVVSRAHVSLEKQLVCSQECSRSHRHLPRSQSWTPCILHPQWQPCACCSSLGKSSRLLSTGDDVSSVWATDGK